MADVLTLSGFSYVTFASGYRDSGGNTIPQASLIGVSDGTKVVPVGPGVPLPVTIVGNAGAPQTVVSAASEAHIGEIGGNVGKFTGSFGPASSTTFGAGTAMVATPIEITSMGRVAGGSGLLTSVTVGLAVANTVQIDLVLFSSQPTGSYTANSAFNVSAGDRAKCLGVVSLTQWTAMGTGGSVGEASPAPKFFSCDDGSKTTSLWAMPVARGSIGPLTAVADASLMVRAGRN